MYPCNMRSSHSVFRVPVVLARKYCTEKVAVAPRQRGDSAFVKRRRSYRDEIHEMRLRFAEELESTRNMEITDEKTIIPTDKEKQERKAQRR